MRKAGVGEAERAARTERLNALLAGITAEAYPTADEYLEAVGVALRAVLGMPAQPA